MIKFPFFCLCLQAVTAQAPAKTNISFLLCSFPPLSLAPLRRPFPPLNTHAANAPLDQTCPAPGRRQRPGPGYPACRANRAVRRTSGIGASVSVEYLPHIYIWDVTSKQARRQAGSKKRSRTIATNNKRPKEKEGEVLESNSKQQTRKQNQRQLTSNNSSFVGFCFSLRLPVTAAWNSGICSAGILLVLYFSCCTVVRFDATLRRYLVVWW